MFLLQEFDCEIKDGKDSENPVTDHRSKIVYIANTEAPIFESFPDE